MEDANTATGMSKEHITRRKNNENDFFKQLCQEPALRVLASLDVESGERLFYARTKGQKTNEKLQTMNNCLKYYALCHLKKNDGSPYQPNTINTWFKVMFGVFHTKGIQYSRTTDFNFEGGWCSFLAACWNKQHALDVTFGDRPNRPNVSDDFLTQVRTAILVKKLLDISGNVLRDSQMIVYFLFGICFLFRGVKVSPIYPSPHVARLKRLQISGFANFILTVNIPPLMHFFFQEHHNLKWENIKEGVYDDDGSGNPLAGLPYIELVGFLHKKKKLSVSRDHISQKGGSMKVAHNPADPISLYTMYKRLKNLAHPEQTYVYCHEASKDLQVLWKTCSLGDVKMHPSRRIGENTIGKVSYSRFFRKSTV
jgi:hypothetical protein